MRTDNGPRVDSNLVLRISDLLVEYCVFGPGSYGSIMDKGTRQLIITIDGPAGAGKSTVSEMLARQLGYLYVDTGAMYRAVAVLARGAGQTNPLDETLLEEICSELDLRFVYNNNMLRLIVNGEDITEEIRKPEISAIASAVSAIAVVRERLTKIQREIGARGGVVF